ncbi:hypothetical protein [Bradyrhizobium quebecense]|uniref:Uncharacterized protein n=2 Tax=Bradyrhizobium quebecense TaxID=2748629 RepID=A0ACD3VD77_9BRAD|nr:hypothetical protein [Bradyrhizobium quebecense]UGY04324.1 hypothetical protein J4P68_0006090 [Bradyrhizobium quebecense]
MNPKFPDQIPEQPASPMQRAAMIASRSPRMIGSLFAEWERSHGQLAAEHLGATASDMAALALCTRPRPASWANDIAEIAVACGIDESRLSEFLRQAIEIEGS